MNHCVPDWHMDDDTRAFPDLLPKGDWLSSQPKISMGPNKELVELLWRNGQVVLHSQTNRKSLPSSDPKPVTAKPEQPIKSGFSGFSTEVSGLTNQNPIQEDVTTSWLHYPLGDSLENEFCPDFFYEMSTLDPIGIEKPNKKVGENSVKTCPSELATNNHGPEKKPQSINQSKNLHFAENFNPGTQSPMLPLEGKIVDTIRAAPSLNLDRVVNFSHFSRPVMASKTVLGSSSEPMGENISGKLTRVEIGESSMTTIGSSNCGSNKVENQPKLFSFPSNGGNTGIFAGAVAEAARKLPFQTDIGETIEPTVTSTSGGSGVSAGRIGKRISMNQSNKRKGRDADESEFQSEETEDDSVEANKPAQRSASARRKRAAEVHNLSERRRRDRINEKMKALQELIPHCNKSDKASMLDEAIEYLKSLQLQLQMMWMGGGMFPVMFPDFQHYMLPMGVGPAPSPAVNGPSQLASPNQLPLCIPPALNPVNLQNQIRNTNFSESYTRFLNFHHMQNSPQMMQQNHTVVQPNTSSETCIRSENVQSGKSG